MHFISKNVHTQQDEFFIREGNVSPKLDPGFVKVRSLLVGRTYFHIDRFRLFNRILL